MSAPNMKRGFDLFVKKTCVLSARAGRIWLHPESCICRCLCTAAGQGSRSSSFSGPDGSTAEGSLAERFKQALTGSPRSVPTRRVLCRTSETDPAKHGEAHEGLFYTIQPDHMSRWLQNCFRPDYLKVVQAFNECNLMVRHPAVEVIGNLRNVNCTLPVTRHVLYGRHGGGKSLTLAHIIHYAATQGWIILHVPWASHWNRYATEVQLSQYKEGRIDLPLESAAWLETFLKMNGSILKELNPKVKNHYVWSRREVSEVGTPWVQVIDFALGRVKYASDVVGMLLKEIRQQASQNSFQVLVAIDGVNAFWKATSKKRPEEKTIIHASDLTLVHNFKKMLKNDWSGGAVVVTVDCKAGDLNEVGMSDQPRFLLGKEGFEFLDPFLPIQVPDYSDKEVHSCLEYFIEQQFLPNPRAQTEDGKKEFIFLSSKNPYELYRVTAPS